MTKNYLLLLTLLIFSSVNSQIISIPDANFKAKLLLASELNSISFNDDFTGLKIDANGDGEIQVSEALKVTSLYLGNSDINSLQGIEKFTNLKKLDCSQNSITSLDLRSLTNLVEVDCGINKLTSLNLQQLSNLKFVSCWRNKLTSLDTNGLSSLTGLDFSENLISTIAISHLTNLVALGCGSNQLTKLDIGGLINLENLYCVANKFTELNTSNLVNLKTLHCSKNELSKLDVIKLTKLEQLDYDYNNITTIDLSSLHNLLDLSCCSNKIEGLDLKGLGKLKTLLCSENKLTALDLSGVPNLEYLNCFGNLLGNLDLSPLSKLNALSVSKNNLKEIAVTKFKDLIFFYCENNQLTSIDVSGLENILNFDCGGNKLSHIDVSDLKRLQRFHYENNTSLESVFMKNGINEIDLLFSGNPNLKYICADENQVTDIQNFIQEYNYKECAINSYCFFSPGGDSFSIQGSNRNDLNNNGCDALDIPASFFKFKIDDGLKYGSFISNDVGKYDIKVAAGKYNVIPVFENPNYFSVSPTSVQVEFPTVSSPFIQDFCVKAIGIHNDLEVTIIPIWPSRPGFVAKYKIIYKNKGTSPQSGMVSLVFNDAVLDIISVNPVVSTTTSNKLTWNFTNLKPFESREIVLSFDVNSPTETPAVNNGDILSYTATINSSENDDLPLDNVFVFNEIVVGSYDPNDKTCLEGNIVTSSLIGEYVHYIIRFENTGTYMAQNIIVKDMIDLSKFDISTLVPTSASHSYTTKISDGNKVEFIFENIKLPFNSVNRNGYIAFKIKTLPTLRVGDTFENEANIYFDYNFPILTNKATSTFKAQLETQDFAFSQYFNIYPNPVQDILNIDSKNTVQKKAIHIFDVLGQTIISVLNAESVSKIDVSKLQTGNYILKVSSDKGNSSFKFVKR